MLLRSAPGLDAVFCGNDQIARGVADAGREAGLRVPEDVALVGFDNWDVIAASCRPPLTTVDMNLRELGRTAGENLLAAIEGPPARACGCCRAAWYCGNPAVPGSPPCRARPAVCRACRGRPGQRRPGTGPRPGRRGGIS